MSWLEKIRKRLGYDDSLPEPPDENEALEASAILQNAKTAFDRTQKQTAEVQVVTTSLASLRTRNHFGESIQLAMMPRGNRG